MTRFVLLLAAGLVSAQAAGFQTPRYRLAPGTILWYTGETETKDSRGTTYSDRLYEDPSMLVTFVGLHDRKLDAGVVSQVLDVGRRSRCGQDLEVYARLGRDEFGKVLADLEVGALV